MKPALRRRPCTGNGARTGARGKRVTREWTEWNGRKSLRNDRRQLFPFGIQNEYRRVCTAVRRVIAL